MNAPGVFEDPSCPFAPAITPDNEQFEQYQDLVYLLSVCKQKSVLYRNHILRGVHECSVRGRILASLKPNQVLVICDWKMKWLVQFFRESQVQFFGKAGIAWHGTMFIFRDPEDPENFLVEYEDTMTDDKKEDGFAVVSAMELGLHSFRNRHPHIDEWYLLTDGANCYSGKYLCMALPEISSWTGCRILAHHTGEPGKNKTSLDAHFATGAKHVNECIATGVCDTTSAGTLRQALAHAGGLASTHSVEMITCRDEDVVAKPKAASLAGITVHSMREYIWDATGTHFFLSLVLRRQSYTGKGVAHSKTMMDKMWMHNKPQQPTCAFSVQKIADRGLAEASTTRPGTVVGHPSPPETSMNAPIGASVTNPLEAPTNNPTTLVDDTINNLEQAGTNTSTILADDTINRLEQASTDIPTSADDVTTNGPEQVPTNVEPTGMPLTSHKQQRVRQKRIARKGDACSGKSSLPTKFLSEEAKRARTLAKAGRNKQHENKAKAEKLRVKNAIAQKELSCSLHFCKHAVGGNEGCQQAFKNAGNLRRHIAKGNHTGGKNSMKKSKIPAEEQVSTQDKMKRLAADPKSGANAVARDISNVQTKLTLSCCQDYTRIDGVNVTLSTLEVGYANKKNRSGKKKYTKLQLDYLKWCYTQGVVNKAKKFSAETAEELMPLHGTNHGEMRYPNDPFWKASAGSKPSFRVRDLLDHWIIKPWFSQQKSKFEKKIAKAAEIAIATNVIPLGNDADLGDIIQDDEHDAAE